MDVDVVAFEGLHERLSHAVGLRAVHRSEARHEPQPNCKFDRFIRPIGTPIVGEPLDRPRRLRSFKALLDSLQHQIADHLAADASSARTPSHDFPVAGIQRKDDAYHLTVPTRDFKASEVHRREFPAQTFSAIRRMTSFHCRRSADSGTSVAAELLARPVMDFRDFRRQILVANQPSRTPVSP